MKQNMRKFLAVILLCSIMVAGMPTLAFNSLTAVEASAEADIIDWIYQIRDFKVWRCLWNYSKACLIGEWELAP